MSLTDNLGTAVGEMLVKTLNRYRLSIPTCDSALDVEDFSGNEGVSSLYRYVVHFTSLDQGISATQMLSKPATLTMGTGVLAELIDQKVVHGVITKFQRIRGSNDQALYQLTIEPFLSLLGKQFRTHRFFINKSVTEVVQQVLQEHGLKDWEYEFVLKNNYPKREQINQYQESDLTFIQRLLSEVGIFYFFTLQPDAQTEVVHFADDQSAWQFGKTLPLNSPSGTNDNKTVSVWDIHVGQRVTQASVIAGDYNHRDAQKILLTAPADATNGEGAGTTYGEVYHYRAGHLESGDKFSPATETGNFRARIEHERFLSGQTQVSGVSTDATLSPGQVLTITETSLIPTLPSATENGVVILSVALAASRSESLTIAWIAVPYSETRCWRPAAIARPVISGTLMARVTSAKANDEYAHLNPNGLYWVKFDADRDEKPQGYESMPVRLAKPYGGDTYGMHFPLIQGTEVAVAFHEGDPDRPYIAHALHDSRHPDHVTADNHTRNVIRTAGLNKLRMEDKRGEEHIKLSTEYGGKTQLNLGHNVDTARALRGEGAELRTDKWVAVRGGAGVFITADRQEQASGMQLEMQATLESLKAALQDAEGIRFAAEKAKAELADIERQKNLMKDTLTALQQQAILLSAPAGIAQITPASMQLSSGENLIVTTGENADFSIAKKFRLGVKETISLFAQKLGIKMYAAQGKIDIQAQDDTLDLLARKTLTIASQDKELFISAKTELTLNCGGAYIRLKDGDVEIGAPGNIRLKCGSLQKMTSASLDKTIKLADPCATAMDSAAADQGPGVSMN
ncbi:type VI secretion system Vgr family protein [Scandinavium lactucae]|uniref:Type VI secretion system tip protein VgrG n=1 Tax=Scandinavium lactucae TaxID=3095028 RepID=A0ABU4QIT7_9ENTR|nr:MULTISPECIES: type VI secretion system tip protein VgrG [unclassified Scandinavium]MDX6039161.1 type VI secretion system tip protein VgrG [Scandinavium sp. V105_6]MDX6050232.1 type VI secretion system tip protein VgrG [Scandinavium sp. V105_1]